jgi:galactokinase
MTEQLQERFQSLFGQQNQHTFFSPGRVNLIGEHIDYNGGLVMPCAITFGTYLLTAPNKEGKFRFRSVNFEEVLDIGVQPSYQKVGEYWYNYPVAVIHHFIKEGKQVQGMDMLFYGNVPIGSGLSSSASIEIATAYALNQLCNAGFSKLDLVKLCKRVENEFIGVNSGIMDQFAVTFGEASKALKLDCETLDYEAVNCFLGDYLLAIINTNKPRKLAESKYNERVGECQAALESLKSELDINYLCDIDSETFDKHKDSIESDVVKDRAEHVVKENERVNHAARELAAHNLHKFGELMYASHESLKNLYEVSGKELDTIVEFCSLRDDVAGARMTGAGFGGCAIALVKKDSFQDFEDKLIPYYTEKIGYAPSVYSSLIGDGVKEI